jgi:hypothetical protein
LCNRIHQFVETQKGKKNKSRKRIVKLKIRIEETAKKISTESYKKWKE